MFYVADLRRGDHRGKHIAVDEWRRADTLYVLGRDEWCDSLKSLRAYGPCCMLDGPARYVLERDD